MGQILTARLRMVIISLIFPVALLCVVPVLQVDASYGKVSVPKCHTEYDTETSYEKRCSTIHEQECETLNEEICTPRVEKLCDTIDVQECTNTYERECSTR